MINNLYKKNILIIGASGRVGQKLVEYSLEAGARVRAFVRNPNSIPFNNSNLEIFLGDVTEAPAVEKAVESMDIVFSSLSGRSTKPDYSVLSIGIENIILGMKSQNVKRLMNVAGAGILDDEKYGLRRDRPGYPIFFRNVSSENLKVLSLLKNSDLDWTTICAPEMPDGIRTESYRVEINYLPENGNRIHVEDVADFMITQCFNEKYYGNKIGIAY